MVRVGVTPSGFNFTLLLTILLILVLLLTAIWIAYHQFKKRKANRVANADRNQQLVSGLAAPSYRPTEPVTSQQQPPALSSTLVPIKEETAVVAAGRGWKSSSHVPLTSKTAEAEQNSIVGETLHESHGAIVERTDTQHNDDVEYEMESPRISMTPNQPGALADKLRRKSLELRTHDEIAGDTGVETTPNQHANHVGTVLREETMLSHDSTTAGTDASLNRRVRKERGERRKKKEFGRPHVGALESVSAISLDEFWQK